MAVTAAQVNNYMGYTTKAKEPSQDMDKDAFMKLLVAQLQNQDPTQQQDPSQMIAQMTSFSQLEQLQNLGDIMKSMMEQNVALFQAQATSLVGKVARINGAPVSFANDGEDGEGNAIKTAGIGMELAGAAKVTMIVRDENGIKVGSKDMSKAYNNGLEFSAGAHDFEWDGTLDEGGIASKDGKYYIEFVAYDSEGKAVTANHVSDQKIDSVAFAEGTVLIVCGGKYYSLGEIIEVKAA